MSVVAVKKYEDRIVIAADSQVTYGNTNRKFGSLKMRRINSDLVIGSVGPADTCGLLWIYFETHSLEPVSCERTIMNFILDFAKWCEKSIGGRALDNDFIIVYKDKIFEVMGYSILEITDYSAIGSGYQMALAALYLGHSPTESVRVACDLTNYVGGPIEEETVEIKTERKGG